MSAESAGTVQQAPEILSEPTLSNITLPAGVPGTALIAYRVSAYDGPFLEDGTDREVFDVAALLVYNGGSKMLTSAEIELKYPDSIYTFTGDYIPPGSWIMLLEQKGRPYRKDAPLGCAGTQTVDFDETVLPVLVEDTTCGMQVCNTGNDTLKDIHVYYKTWLHFPGFYIGGITYHSVIPQLEPGQWVSLQPYHYAPGSSKVVSISGRK